MKILIVDDEPLARERLGHLVADLGVGEVVGEAGNGAEVFEEIRRCEPDLLLLDIRMPGMDGIEVARHLSALPRPPAVIFTTAYDAHALAAIEANAVDYLLKPIRRERLAAALERATTLTRAQLAGLEEARDEPAARTHVSATLHGTLRLMPVTDIRYFRAEHKYVTVRHLGGELVVEDSLSTLEEEFCGRFVRVHRNCLVSLAHVRALERDSDGHHRVKLEGIEEPVEVSRRMVSRVRQVLRSR